MSDRLTTRQPSAPATTAIPENLADAYGQPISVERQAELQGYLDRWQAETDHGSHKGPFDNGYGSFGVLLTGADVSWLVQRTAREGEVFLGPVPNLRLGGANLFDARLQGADLRTAHLESAYLGSAHLEGADLWSAHLEGANLSEAHLEGANLRFAHLEGVSLQGASLDSKTAITDAILDTSTRLGDI